MKQANYADYLQLSFGDLQVYEGSNEHTLTRRNMEALLLWVWKMQGLTIDADGELTVHFEDGMVVDRPKKGPIIRLFRK